jgi:hypothetical protein
MFAMQSHGKDTCFGDFEYQQENKTELRGLDYSCLTYVGVLPLADYQIVDVRTDHKYVTGLSAVTGGLQATVPELTYRNQLKSSPLLLVDQGHDVALMSYYCHKLNSAGFKQVKIAVGGLSALLQAQPSLATQTSDESLVYLSPRQAYALLENGYGQVVVLDKSVKKFEVAEDAVFTAPEGLVSELKTLQKKVSKVSQWKPILLVGNDRDYQQYLQQLKRPLAGVYLLQGGWSEYQVFKQQYQLMMAKRNKRESSPCKRR